MNCFRLLLCCLAFPAVLLAADMAEAAVRKCQTTRNGLAVNASEPILVLNGQVVGPLPSQQDDPQPGHLLLNHVISVPKDDILLVEIVCLELSEGGQMIGRAAVAVVTKAGAVEFMRSHLQALAELQELHHASTATYAKSLLELHFFDSRAPLPIVLTTDQDGWLAKIELEGVNGYCQVHGGSPEGLPSDRPANVVQCVAT